MQTRSGFDGNVGGATASIVFLALAMGVLTIPIAPIAWPIIGVITLLLLAFLAVLAVFGGIVSAIEAITDSKPMPRLNLQFDGYRTIPIYWDGHGNCATIPLDTPPEMLDTVFRAAKKFQNSRECERHHLVSRRK